MLPALDPAVWCCPPWLSPRTTACQTEGVQDRGSVITNHSAVKLTNSFCRFVAPTVLQSSSHRILSLLLPLLGQATGETLYLVLETIRAVLGLDEALLDVENVGEVVEPLYAIWEANTSGKPSPSSLSALSIARGSETTGYPVLRTAESDTQIPSPQP